MGKAKKTIYRILIGRKLGKPVVAFDATTPQQPTTQTGQQLTPTQQQSLAQHDKIYHPNGYKQGQKCKFRDNLGLGKTPDEYDDEVDFLGDASQVLYDAVKEVNQLAKNPQYQPNQQKLDAINDYLVGLKHIAPRDAQAQQFLNRANDIAKYRQGGFKKKIGRVSKFDSTKWVRPGQQSQTAQQSSPGTQTSNNTPSQQQNQTTGGQTNPSTLKLQSEEQDLITTVSKLTAQVSSCPQALQGIFKKALGIAQNKLNAVQQQLKAAGAAVANAFRLNLGKNAMVQDGDTGAVINAKRKAEGLKPMVSLAHIDANVAAANQGFMQQSKMLAQKYADPGLDISNPQDFATADKNFGDTVKRLINENRICTVIKAHRLIDFLNAGVYKTKIGKGNDMDENYRHAYGLSATSKAAQDEAPISATLLSSDKDRMFESTAFDVYGVLAVEWRKDGELVPAFSNCDCAQAMICDRQYTNYNGMPRTYQPSLVSDPHICSLAAFEDGRDGTDFRMRERLPATGVKAPNGLMMPSHTAAIKLFRQGPLKGDALDFEHQVNNAQVSPYTYRHGSTPSKRDFGWTEIQMLGKGTLNQVGAIHVSSTRWAKNAAEEKKWASVNPKHDHGTVNKWATAQAYVNDLVKSHGQMLKQNGIKLVLDGQEVQL